MTVKNTRDKPVKEKVRLSLDISPELNELLETLATTTGGTKSEVLRKAIALMEVVVEAKRQGKKFGIAEKDQPLATEIIGV
ncbi:MAG TPA: ribbon-helix-helix domain-containing protein [Pyrinomonadaceae bacterium]|jgi:predicted transcriptional regulator